ncbi:MAG: hypothetical protein ACRYF3_05930 [Janthinobacterium lividum]
MADTFDGEDVGALGAVSSAPEDWAVESVPGAFGGPSTAPDAPSEVGDVAGSDEPASWGAPGAGVSGSDIAEGGTVPAGQIAPMSGTGSKSSERSDASGLLAADAALWLTDAVDGERAESMLGALPLVGQDPIAGPASVDSPTEVPGWSDALAQPWSDQGDAGYSPLLTAHDQGAASGSGGLSPMAVMELPDGGSAFDAPPGGPGGWAADPSQRLVTTAGTDGDDAVWAGGAAALLSSAWWNGAHDGGAGAGEDVPADGFVARGEPNWVAEDAADEPGAGVGSGPEGRDGAVSWLDSAWDSDDGANQADVVSTDRFDSDRFAAGVAGAGLLWTHDASGQGGADDSTAYETDIVEREAQPWSHTSRTGAAEAARIDRRAAPQAGTGGLGLRPVPEGLIFCGSDLPQEDEQDDSEGSDEEETVTERTANDLLTQDDNAWGRVTVAEEGDLG